MEKRSSNNSFQTIALLKRKFGFTINVISLKKLTNRSFSPHSTVIY